MRKCWFQTCSSLGISHTHTTVLWPFFPERPRWAGGRRELLDFMMQPRINGGRHVDHPAGRHSIRTNQWPPLPSRHIFYTPDAFLLPNQQCQSTEGNISKYVLGIYVNMSFFSNHSLSSAFTLVWQSCRCTNTREQISWRRTWSRRSLRPVVTRWRSSTARGHSSPATMTDWKLSANRNGSGDWRRNSVVSNVEWPCGHWCRITMWYDHVVSGVEWPCGITMWSLMWNGHVVTGVE